MFLISSPDFRDFLFFFISFFFFLNNKYKYFTPLDAHKPF